MKLKLRLDERPVLLATILFFIVQFIIIALNQVTNIIYISFINFLILIHFILFFNVLKCKKRPKIFLKTFLQPFFYFIFLSLAVYVLNLFVSGKLWDYTWLILTTLPLLSGIIFTFYTIFYEGSFNDSFFKKRVKKYKKIIDFSTTLSYIVIISLVLSPFLIIWGDYTFTDNKTELQNLVDQIIEGQTDDTNKTLSLLYWFDHGEGKTEEFSNIYYRERQEDNEILLNVGNNFYIFSKSPHLCARGDEDMWIFCSRCGRCGEVAILLNTMGNYASLDMRKVVCKGEDHVWNEVNIGGQWIVLDATAVNLPDRTGFNLSTDFMENKVRGEYKSEVRPKEGNVSYVYAIYPNDPDTKVDITSRYTNTTNITIFTSDVNNKSLDDVAIKVYSLNSANENNHDTIIMERKTNISGCFTFTLGDGRYKFIAEKGELKGILKDNFVKYNNKYSRTIYLE